MKSLRPKSASTSKEVKQFLRVLKEKKAYYQNIDEEILMPQFPRHRQAKIKKEDLAKDFLKEKINKLKLEINEQATVICIQEISALKVKINKSKF